MAGQLSLVVLLALHSVIMTLRQECPIPKEIEQLFEQLDRLGRDQVKQAEFVELIFDRGSDTAWLVEQDDAQVVVLMEDLLPWTFLKKKPTRVPSSWRSVELTLEEIKPSDFEELCRDLANRKEEEEPRMRLHRPEASYRVLVAHAAWTKGLGQYCVPILEGEPGYGKDKTAFAREALDALAWLQYLRGVNLLMYADRQEALPHLRLTRRIAPDSDHAKAAADLLRHLERMVAAAGGSSTSQPTSREIAGLSEEKRAQAYIEQLKDLHCVQISQPGEIIPYATLKVGSWSEDTPSARLKEMGCAAVPALIRALEDDTPTRTVYHWRDFAHYRQVWRVSGFAWHILRDIAKREFGYQAVVGFTYGSMNPDEQRAAREEIRRWYEETKDLSPDDRMMTYFSSTTFEDWVTAAEYFAEKKDRRPVPLLLETLKGVRRFQTGELCEVIAEFDDKATVGPIRDVLKNADEASDRIQAAIALWRLGDSSGVPVAIEYVTAEKQPYGSWDTPVWFLMRCGTDEAMAALKQVVETSKPKRAGEVIGFITAAISGDVGCKQREPAGSVKVADILVAAMDRADETGMKINDVKARIKDQAAVALVVLRDGRIAQFGGPFVHFDPSVFNIIEPDVSKRDAQIEVLKGWYTKHRGQLGSDEKENRLRVMTEARER